ncbi:MAG: beta-Ala-His dipeptidase [Candidatus Nomurabacteria bacterium]|nr:beta-Ala-His dipeptidase [Candidatus Nomurabacteria bacterium]
MKETDTVPVQDTEAARAEEVITKNGVLLSPLKKKLPFWRHFETLCATPRGSWNEGPIASVIEDLAKKNGLEVIKDKWNNVLVTVPASKGFEHIPSVCLQGHIDMVEVKDKGLKKEIFPIELFFKTENVLKAIGTTLGADNGIAISYMLEILTNRDIEHGPLELLFTATEEVGLVGAIGFDFSSIKSTKFINLDSEEEGEFTVGCAGGSRINGLFKPKFINTPSGYCKFNIELSDFVGGHSGAEIQKERGNAIKDLAIILTDLGKFNMNTLGEIKMHLVSFSGGEKDNAIPVSAKATVVLPEEDAENFLEILQKQFEAVKMVWPKEPIKTEVARVGIILKEKMMDENSTKDFLEILIQLPHGVRSKQKEDKKLVQTSNNLAIVEMKGRKIAISCMYRSSNQTQLKGIGEIIKGMFHYYGAKTKISSGYPGWIPQFDTPLLKTAVQQWEVMFDAKPVVTSTHGGLECGVISNKLKGVEIISFGPTMGDVHTTGEWVDVDSCERVWKYLLLLLKSI